VKKRKAAKKRRRAAPRGIDQRKLGRNPATEPPKAKRSDDL
jgi:hypothetical protein